MKKDNKKDLNDELNKKWLKDGEILDKLKIFIRIGGVGMFIGIAMSVITYATGEMSEFFALVLFISWIIFIIPKVWSDNINKKWEKIFKL